MEATTHPTLVAVEVASDVVEGYGADAVDFLGRRG